MIFSVVGSFIYTMKRRTVMELISPELKELWKAWDLRLTVLLSLTLQVVLIFLGYRRKYSRNYWIRIVVWLAYITADSVATCALGLLSNNLADVLKAGGSMDPNVELTALWAPFLLLHLGGPDTITAYALEDNELWLRHLLGLVVQTGVAFYVFIMAWTGSHLSILFIVLFLVGLMKYGERTWILRSSSSEKLRESMSESSPFISADIDLEKQTNVENVITAHNFFPLTKCFFSDVILNFKRRETTVNVFRKLSSRNAFRVIEIELGFMYDFFYTKKSLHCTQKGLVLRLVTFFLTCSVLPVLLLFSFLHQKHYRYSNFDLLLTLILLVMAIVLEMYSALVLVSSDQFLVWLCKRNQTRTFQILTSHPLFKNPRWSNNVSQFSFLRFVMGGNPLPFRSILEPLKFAKKLEKPWNVTYEKVDDKLEDVIFKYLSLVGGANWENYECPNLREELGKSILFWHIVTEVLYNYWEQDIRKQSLITQCELTRRISRYMLYLLVVHPSMVSAGMSQFNFEETVNEAKEALEHWKASKKSGELQIPELPLEFPSPMRSMLDLQNLARASKMLLHVRNTRENDFRSNLSLLLPAMICGGIIVEKTSEEMMDEIESSKETIIEMVPKGMRLWGTEGAPQKSLTERWYEIQRVWLGILTYAASKCKAQQHAQQLRNGGEFLTHVWLLMAHFGLTEHFPL